MKHSAFLCSLFVLYDSVGAVRLALEGRSAPAPSALRRRADAFGQSTLNDTFDILYSTNITLGGKEYTVQIDTGSSDLWVADQVPNSKLTGKSSSVSYASGSASGPIATAPLLFAGYNVSDQAFLQVTPDSQNAPGSGLIGLGPSSSSNIHQAYSGQAGDPPLDRIFRQNVSTPNYLSFLLGRAVNPDDPLPGQLSVGEILPGYENISSQPKLDVTALSVLESSSQHWQILLDEDGFVGPNGTIIPITSKVSKLSNPQQARVIIDTGFTLPQVPKSVADAIYSNVTGAVYQNVSGVGEIWTLPCDQEVNITFKFGGQSFPVHPLDTSLVTTNVIPQGNNSFCVGSFQPQSFSFSGPPTFDIIFGMAFLRNVYGVINFGDFVDGGSSKADPYVQFLSTTNDTAKAHQEFVKVRLGGVDTTKQVNLLGTSNGSTAPKKKKTSSVVKIIVIAVVVGLVGLIAVVGICCFCGKRLLSKRGKRTGGVLNGSYRPLNEPAPAPALDMHAVPNPLPANYGYHNPYEPPRY